MDGLVQDCSNSSANALELLQSCTKPSIYFYNDSISLYQSLNMPEDEVLIDHKSSSMFWLGAWSIMALFMQKQWLTPISICQYEVQPT